MRMINSVGAIFFILFGLFFIFFHFRLSNFAINFWHKRFPRLKIWQKGYEVFFLVAGIVFVAFGLLVILQIIRPE